MFTGGTAPEALPKLAITPSGARQSSESMNVSLPTPSYTTGTPLPLVISRTRPTLGSYTATRADLEAAARDLFAVVKKGAVKIAINQTYPLREAAQAHRDLEGRKTTGSTVLLP